MSAVTPITTHDIKHLSGCDPTTALVRKDGSKFWRGEPTGATAGTVLPDGAVVIISYAELADLTSEEDWRGEGWARELLPEAAARIAEKLNAG